MNRKPVAYPFVILAALAPALGACDALDPSGLFAEKYKPEVVPDVPADKLYAEGLAKLEDRDYEAAAKSFDGLDKAYAYSDWSRKGLLMTAFAHYEGARFDDAANTAKRYLQRHPSSPDAPYAQYLMAMSQYRQIPDVSRDQDRAEKALATFQDLVQRYPKSEYVAEAKAKIQVTRDQLAGKEMEVGRYYLGRRAFPAAINRFRDVVSKYQTTRHAEEALARLVEAYAALGIVPEAQVAAAVLGHNFPDSPWYRDSLALLGERGVQPREDAGSWISRAFASLGPERSSSR